MFSLLKRHADLLPLGLVTLLAVGCGGGGGAGGDESSAAADGDAAAPVIDETTAATISGSVTFSGTAPALAEIDMSEESVCADKYTSTIYAQNVVVNDNGTLRNVFVYVKDGLGDMSFPAPSDPVTLDQNGCRYMPHVFGIQVGQELAIKNSDGILHNINAKPSANRGFNISQPVEMETRRSFRVPEIGVPLECDVHGWMQSYVNVVEHPYHAVTREDGSFSLAPLPPGTYTIEAWHEEYGTQTMEVTVGESESAEITFSFGESAA